MAFASDLNVHTLTLHVQQHTMHSCLCDDPTKQGGTLVAPLIPRAISDQMALLIVRKVLCPSVSNALTEHHLCSTLRPLPLQKLMRT